MANSEDIGGLLPCDICGTMNPVGMQCHHPLDFRILTEKGKIMGVEDKYNINKSDTLKRVNALPNVGIEDDSIYSTAHEELDNVIKRNKYMREILPGVWVDVYDVIAAFDVSDGGYQHALKKILACGQRGHKSEVEDRKDILASVTRSNEIFERS